MQQQQSQQHNPRFASNFNQAPNNSQSTSKRALQDMLRARGPNFSAGQPNQQQQSGPQFNQQQRFPLGNRPPMGGGQGGQMPPVSQSGSMFNMQQRMGGPQFNPQQQQFTSNNPNFQGNMNPNFMMRAGGPGPPGGGGNPPPPNYQMSNRMPQGNFMGSGGPQQRVVPVGQNQATYMQQQQQQQQQQPNSNMNMQQGGYGRPMGTGAGVPGASSNQQQQSLIQMRIQTPQLLAQLQRGPQNPPNSQHNQQMYQQNRFQ